ncbi:MAG: Holliday junction resolvase RuvX [Nitrospirae bacterium CG_4_9_14_3_um_filter_53_35]|nr:MAG: Holliday junction DNA helicase RuvA [Nitrospirae bacterium CG2_30_53_67]PIS36933.1 MAG: Holliday junction resolvase RuvX [Nitrospirae bacterium CG08_land_8_20_14_0_20_52_24]PIV85303.1 MAG: Holliday junction resolvase RuvX [Nitrospirae bacterium CG17_big_fil_post_rev_8_21_14_2_50_50_9]PIW85578.1 MAG: Holliday junction resolvase RuvX [Nitrospirae bacterium CG_4_8_14_3_um_filter_50_41]PIX85842.1 MAG: Holliday junction resolvase RuvX [Nitrospirae bacterium CG_4_10_14_3_um_filter_53_41]PJA7
MRILGLDLGDKTIGVAVSDELGITAQPLKTIRRKEITADLNALQDLIREYQAECLVVGLPMNMNGSLGPAARKAMNMVEKLEGFNIPVITQDERLTTVMVERMMIQGDVRRERRKKVINQVAAALILQGYLDRRAREHQDEI